MGKPAAASEASRRRQALINHGLLVLPPKNEAKAAAARKSHEARARNKAAKDAQLAIEASTDKQRALAAVATAGNSLATVSAISQSTGAQSNSSAIILQKQDEARMILAESAPKAAKYLADLVTGAIPDVSERIKLEAAKAILTSQGIMGTGAQQAGSNAKDINTMSKNDLMSFIAAGTAELKRLQSVRDAGIIDVTPEQSDAESDGLPSNDAG